MPCPFAQTKLRENNPPISVIHDFAELPILLGGEKDEAQIGNPIVPGSELPTEEYDEKAEGEQRRRDDEPKDNPCI